MPWAPMSDLRQNTGVVGLVGSDTRRRIPDLRWTGGSALHRFVPLRTATLIGVVRCGGMPRYYFHMRDGSQLLPDNEGSELYDLNAAKTEALAAAADILVARIQAGRPLGDAVFEIADETGAVVMSIPLRAALHLE